MNRINSFVKALINMVREVKITSGPKNCVKIQWWSDIMLKSYLRKSVTQLMKYILIHKKSIISEIQANFKFDANWKKATEFHEHDAHYP